MLLFGQISPNRPKCADCSFNQQHHVFRSPTHCLCMVYKCILFDMCPKYQKSIPTNFTTTFDCCLEKLHRFDRFFLDEAKMCTTSQSNLAQALDLKHKTYDETDKRCPCHVHSQHFQFDISVWPCLCLFSTLPLSSYRN